MTAPDHDDRAGTGTDASAEVVPREDATELRARAARVRERSRELIEALGPDHPLVTEALLRAEALEHEADRPGEIRLH